MASALRLRLAQCMRSIPGDRLQTVEAIQQDGLPCYAFQFVRGDALTCVPGGSQAFCVRPVVLAQMSFDNGEDVSDRDRLRSEERRVGKECVSRCRSRGSRIH